MANVRKNAQGFGYRYTDLAEINNYLESIHTTYYQYIETVDGVDYIMTVINENGLEHKPRRGCRIVEAKLSGKNNPVQAYGASLTYSRRYSLLMAAGLATEDTDAEGLTADIKTEPETISKTQAKTLHDLAERAGLNDEWLLQRCHVSRLGEITNEQYAAVAVELSSE